MFESDFGSVVNNSAGPFDAEAAENNQEGNPDDHSTRDRICREISGTRDGKVCREDEREKEEVFLGFHENRVPAGQGP